ncbi:5352_t:CDS:10 [Diversispora eburnea]|uniref:5352_t:CDS:1 n=1 Tax=Diversispora eburnea TaxID=1213867 RepID=A0A9N8UWT4_9GLOM|nr:5352_t:CDS:10 [Diversispora eburnea]
MKCARIFAFLIVSALAACVCGEEEFPIPSPPPPSSPIEDSRPEFKPTEIEAPFLEQFTDDWSTRWSASEATKVNTDGGETFSYVGKWEVEEPTVYRGIRGDKGLVVKTAAAHHAISARLKTPLDNTNKALVVQYEVKLQNGLECGGAYLKLLTESDKGIQAVEFSDKTPYTIMFGPDRCGSTNKVHFIVRHKNPLTGDYEEKHLDSAPSAKISKISTLYTLIVNPDNTFEIKINNETTKSDSKPTDWVDNPKIPDPAAKKPDDWDEDAPVEILDEEAQKPEGWLDDEPLNVPDPEAKKPEDWDDEEDGDWVPPSISNPKCEDAPGCGEWKRPMKRNPNYKGKWYPTEIDNPEYKGPWKPRKIPNPDFYEDLTPSNFEKIGAVGFELWTMQSDILFDNIYIGHSVEDAQKFAEETWKTPISLWEDPVKFLQQHINEFLAIFFEDPLEAIKTKPEVAGGLATVAIIFFSLLGLLFGLIAPSKKVSASHKKTDARTPDDKGADKGTSVKKDDGSEGDNELEPNPVTNRGKKQRRDD